MMKVASISEFKDTLSAYLDQVRSGEIVVITDRKSPIATLERIAPGSLSQFERHLVSDGIVAPRKRTLNVDALLSIPSGKPSSSLVTAILEERAETR